MFEINEIGKSKITNQICNCCMFNLPIENFYMKSPRHNRRMRICKKCFNIKEKQIKLNRYATPESSKKAALNKMFLASRTRARKQNLPFNLDLEWFEKNIQERCPILGITFDFVIGRGNIDSLASIDKIIPELGYIKENCQIISFRANRLKCDGTLKEFKYILNYMLNFKPIIPTNIIERNGRRDPAFSKYYKRFDSLIRSAESRNVEFSLTLGQLKYLIESTKVCPVLNIPLIQARLVDNGISIDRIDNSRGYEIDNVAIISRRANSLKNDATTQEIKNIINYIELNAPKYLS
jgi:hypothetical protein